MVLAAIVFLVYVITPTTTVVVIRDRDRRCQAQAHRQYAGQRQHFKHRNGVHLLSPVKRFKIGLSPDACTITPNE
jgi:hypothetical protein